MHARLVSKHAAVREHPAPTARCCQEDPKGYPLAWAELHGNALHPLQLTYREHIAFGLPRWGAGAYIGDVERADRTRAGRGGS